MAVPSIDEITSPTRKPAFSAGLFGVISCMTSLLSVVFSVGHPNISFFVLPKEG